MAFGFSFGKKKTSQTQDTTINKTETGTQSGIEATNQLKDSSSVTSSNISGTQSDLTKTTGTTSNVATGTKTGTQSVQSFSDTLLAALEGRTLDALGSEVAGPRAAELSKFDPQQFISDGLRAAGSRISADLEQNVNGLFDAIGGTSGGNTMAALLQARLNNDAAASEAGIRGQLNKDAYDTVRANVGATTAEQATSDNFVSSLLQALKGGKSTAVDASATSEASQGTTQQIGESQQQQQQQQQSQTNTTEQLVGIVQNLLNSITNTTGTENVVGKTKNSGGGFSLGF